MLRFIQYSSFKIPFLVAMFSTSTQIHSINLPSDVELPSRFDYPFQYTPHEIAKLASKELQDYLESQKDFKGGFDQLGLSLIHI